MRWPERLAKSLSLIGIIGLSILMFSFTDTFAWSDVPKKKVVAPKKRSGPFKGYGKYSSSIKKLCEAIHKDGRLDFFVISAKQFSDRDPNCEACRPLMQSIGSNCGLVLKQKVAPKKKSPVTNPEQPLPTPTIIPLQREPSALTLDRAVRLFDSVAADKDINQKSEQSIAKLRFVLTDKNRTTNAAREYFDLLFTYINAVLKEHASSIKAGSSTEKSVEIESKNVDSLFE